MWPTIQLPDSQCYTGHSLRRSSATSVACGRFWEQITNIKRLGGELRKKVYPISLRIDDNTEEDPARDPGIGSSKVPALLKNTNNEQHQ